MKNILFLFSIVLLFVSVFYGTTTVTALDSTAIQVDDESEYGLVFEHGETITITGTVEKSYLDDDNDDDINTSNVLHIEISELGNGIVLRDTISINDSTGRFEYTIEPDVTIDWYAAITYHVMLSMDENSETQKRIFVILEIPEEKRSYSEHPELMFEMPGRLNVLSDDPLYVVDYSVVPNLPISFRPGNNNDDFVSIECNPPPNSEFYPGVYDVMCTGENKNGYTASNSIKIIIPDAPQHVPSWFKETTNFWVKKQIDEKTFKTALEYLLEKRIIIVPYIENDHYKRFVDYPISDAGGGYGTYFKEIFVFWQASDNPAVRSEVTDSDLFLAIQRMINHGVIKSPSSSYLAKYEPQIVSAEPYMKTYDSSGSSLSPFGGGASNSSPPKPENAGDLASAHEHASIMVSIFTDKVDFSKSNHQIKSPWIHFEGGDGITIHRHATNVPLWYLFETLSMKLVDECFFLTDERSFCDNDDYSLSFYINSEQMQSIQDYVIKDGDKILIVYGEETPEQIAKLLDELDSLKIGT